MKIKWFLILTPTLLSLVLLQSYFWVPTYETQTKGNPDRVTKFISASIADAKILNPALNADTASSQITGLVFEGLLDYDEELNFRGRLATNWTITETVYLIVNSQAQFPDGTRVTPSVMEMRIKQAIENGKLVKLKELVAEISLLSPQQRIEEVTLRDSDGKPLSVQVTLNIPERIKFSLRRVDQHFFEHLRPILGINYEKQAPLEQWVEVSSPDKRKLVQPQLAQLIPIFEHNPIILFHLRAGVRFQDDHEFDAGDVKFTYESIIDPKNLSPRTSDFEPIKAVEIVDRYTVRVVYKRLFSPAINAWSMGILPEHLLNDAALQHEMDKRQLSAATRAGFGMRDSQFNRHPIGAGAFSFVKWQGDEFIHLTRNEDYWEGAPEYKDYYYRIIPDPSRSGIFDRCDR